MQTGILKIITHNDSIIKHLYNEKLFNFPVCVIITNDNLEVGSNITYISTNEKGKIIKDKDTMWIVVTEPDESGNKSEDWIGKDLVMFKEQILLTYVDFPDYLLLKIINDELKDGDVVDMRYLKLKKLLHG